MPTRMATESGIETPNAEDLARFDRKRKGKTLSNADWKRPTDPEAKLARMKDGTPQATRARGRSRRGDQGHTMSPSPTLEATRAISARSCWRRSMNPLTALDGGVWKTRIAEPDPASGDLRWRGDDAAQKAVYAKCGCFSRSF